MSLIKLITKQLYSPAKTNIMFDNQSIRRVLFFETKFVTPA